MQRSEVRGAIRPLYVSLGFKGLNIPASTADMSATSHAIL